MINHLSDAKKKRRRHGTHAQSGFIAAWLAARFLDRTERAITAACNNERFQAFIHAGQWWIDPRDIRRYLRINNEKIATELVELCADVDARKPRDPTPDMFESFPEE